MGTIIETEIYRSGLDPQLGFFHQPAYGRPSLMLDVLEEFRPLVDLLVLRLLNRRQLGPADFEQRTDQSLAEVLADEPPPAETAEPLDALPDQPAPAATPPNPQATQAVVGVYLNPTGRKIFLAEFFRRLRQRMQYPPRDAVLELRDIVREQIYHLARVIEGHQPDYLPFVPG